MFEISDQSISDSFFLKVRIDNDLEEAMMRHFLVGHEKKRPHPAWDMIDRCSNAAAPPAKTDPALKRIFDFFFFRHRKPLEHAGTFHPLSQITDVGYIRVSNVETRNIHYPN